MVMRTSAEDGALAFLLGMTGCNLQRRFGKAIETSFDRSHVLSAFVPEENTAQV
jgi:hypothetical protein